MLALLNPVAGLQLYVVAPLAVMVTLLPEQMLALAGNTVTVGVLVTVTVTIWVPLQPLLLPVTV
jgi:hypothetical protein